MYHVSAQGVDERIINVRYYYYKAILNSNSLSCRLLVGVDVCAITGNSLQAETVCLYLTISLRVNLRGVVFIG